MTKLHWLEITESVFLAGSVLGTIAAAGTQQALYAAAPLTVTVGLNIANRQRLYNQLNRQHHEAISAEVHQVTDPLCERVEQIDSLRQRIDRQTQQQISQLKESIEQHSEAAIAEVDKAIQSLAPIPNIEPITLRLQELESQMQEVHRQMEEGIDRLTESFRQENETEIARVYQAIESIPPIPNIKPISLHLEQLEELTHQVKSETEQQLDRFKESFQQQSEAAIARLYELIESIPAPPNLEPVNERLALIESALAETPKPLSDREREELQQASAQLQQLIQSLPATPNLDAIHQRIEELQTLTEQLKTHNEEQIDRLQASVRERYDAAIAQFTQPIDLVTQRLDRLESQAQAFTLPTQEPSESNPDTRYQPLPELTEKVTPPTPKFSQDVADSTSAPDKSVTQQQPEIPNAPPPVQSKYRTETFDRKQPQPTPPSPPPAEFDPETVSEERSATEAEKNVTPKLPLKQLAQPESLGRVIGEIESSLGEVVGDLQGFVGKFIREKATPDAPSTNPSGENLPNPNWKCVQTLTAHIESVNSVAISPDGLTLASGDRDNTIKLWLLETGEEIRSFSGEDWFASVNSVVFSPDGNKIACAIGDAIQMWQLSDGTEINSLTGHSESVYSVVFSNNGQQIVSCDGNKTIRIWQPDTGKEIRTLTGHNGIIYSLAISPDGKILASGSADNTIKLWQLNTGKEICTLTGHTDAVNSVAIAPDGKTLASGSADTTIELWQVDTAEKILTLTGHTAAIKFLAFSPDGETIASGSEDKTIKIWHRETGSLIRTLKRHSSAVNCLVFSPDGQTMVSGGEDKTIKIWRCK